MSVTALLKDGDCLRGDNVNPRVIRLLKGINIIAVVNVNDRGSASGMAPRGIFDKFGYGPDANTEFPRPFFPLENKLEIRGAFFIKKLSKPFEGKENLETRKFSSSIQKKNTQAHSSFIFFSIFY